MIDEDASICPRCGGQLKYYDKVNRFVKSNNRVLKCVKLRRFRCPICGSIHRELPHYIYPYKQYDSRIIKAVLDGLITSDTLGFEDYPCEMTMIRWLLAKNTAPIMEH